MDTRTKNPPRKILGGFLFFSCGGRILTCGLRVMSPTSYRTAPPRGVFLYCTRRGSGTQTGGLVHRITSGLVTLGFGVVVINVTIFIGRGVFAFFKLQRTF